SPSLSASETLRRIIQTSAIADAALLDARARAQRVTALVTLLRFAADRQDRLRPPGDLRTFIEDYLEDLRSGGGDDSGALDASDMVDGHESTAETQRDEVLLVTAHSAKGLEFDTVFVPGVSPRAQWPGSGSREAPAIATPPNLCGQQQTDDQKSADALDEQRRLFYVACTRARQRLVILSQRNKSRSKNTNFYEEVALDQPSARLVSIIDQDAALALSAMTPPSAWDRAIDLDARQARRELIYRLRQRARQEAAAAFDALEAADDWSQQLPGVVDTLERSAARIAALSAISRGEPASAIASALARSTSDAATADVAALVARLQAHADPTAGQSAGVVLHTSVQQLFATRGLLPTRVRPPLRLSYTMIDAYRRCPMCFFLRYVLGMPEEEREATEIGSVAHAALERFYRLWSAADAEGVARPGKSELIAIARKLFFQSLPAEARADKALLGMLIAQLELLYDRLHDENAHVLEIERQVRMTFRHAGFDHTIDAKIDRVDRDEHGLRIIDYKTGKAWKRLLEPAPDDLQLGLYAMALDQLYADDPIPNIGDSTPPPRSNPGTPPAHPAAVVGHAEYWVLSTGQRGSIALDGLDRPKIDQEIRTVIDGILAGDWTPEAKCAGLCALFRA
ncbi:MAG: PD-(D/E)XK nuclease family protein, partial [Phycisphaerales bacterium]|nr:PD-(D/E)XK nuclease family protein [Phycisphaerales bacterium]